MKGMTDATWGKLVSGTTQHHAMECVVSSNNKVGEKLEPMSKYSPSADVESVVSSDGVVNDVSSLRNILQGLMKTPDAEPGVQQEPSVHSHVVGVCHASVDDSVSRLTSLCDDDDYFQVGRRRPHISTEPAGPPAKRQSAGVRQLGPKPSCAASQAGTPKPDFNHASAATPFMVGVPAVQSPHMPMQFPMSQPIPASVAHVVPTPNGPPPTPIIHEPIKSMLRRPPSMHRL